MRGETPMYIRKFDPRSFEREYGERTLRIAPADDLPAPPFGAMWAVIEPGQSSAPDVHHEAELFLIVEGDGVVEVDGVREEVSSGDAVHVLPFDTHTFHNTSGDEELRLLSLWWEDRRLLRGAEQRWDAAAHERGGSKVLLTATPPTVNGELHLGHISGPYLAADIYRRYLQMRGREVYSITGSDENQSYVVTKARQRDWTPVETAAWFGDRVERALEALRIETDVFARPSGSQHHARFCREFFSRLHAAGALELRTSPSLHCDRCDRYLFEAHVSGRCPHCGHGSDGCACEDCARPNDCVDLVEPRCNGCGSVPSIRDTRRFYFPLRRYEEPLRTYLRSVRMTPHLAALCERMIDDGLPDIAVSHVADWGIPVPLDGFEDQVIYVWLEMCPGYLAATEELADRNERVGGWEEIWKDPAAEIVQFFGFDNGYFHALLFPALLMAYDPEIRLPSALVSNEFYLLEGEKFSSSREHAIWAAEFAEGQPSDCVRFYLSLDRPEERRTSFTLDEYERRTLASLGQRVVDEFEGRAPGTGTYTAAHEQFYRLLTRLVRQMEDALDTGAFSPSQAVHILSEMVHAAVRFGVSQSYLAGIDERRDERRTAVALELAAARSLATMASPVLPDLTSRLWGALGFEGDEGPDRWESAVTFLPVGQEVEGLRNLTWPSLITSADAGPAR
jgi:methionyl-tRNA synthetase